MTLSRRELFGMFRRRSPATSAAPATSAGPATSAAPASPRTFSLDAFYAKRAAEPAMPALAPELVPEVLPHRCLAASSFCSVCVEHCPAPGAIVNHQGTPRVIAELCHGCGRCIAACPAPILALALVPRPRRAQR